MAERRIRRLLRPPADNDKPVAPGRKYAGRQSARAREARSGHFWPSIYSGTCAGVLAVAEWRLYALLEICASIADDARHLSGTRDIADMPCRRADKQPHACVAPMLLLFMSNMGAIYARQMPRHSLFSIRYYTCRWPSARAIINTARGRDAFEAMRKHYMKASCRLALPCALRLLPMMDAS